MKIRATMASIHAAPRAPSRRLLAALLAAATLLPLAACHKADTRKAANGPLFVRQAGQIAVPDGSPLRARLLVAAAGAAAATHTVALPASVEADPARTVNILPPLTGRLLELKVRLGDKVEAGQVLAVIGAPDLAQALADSDKARDALALAQRALARASGVNAAGANASKDLEQAESAQAQAQAEATRADARLKTLGAEGKNGARSHALAVTAPQAGTVTALNSGVGAFLNDPTAALMTIANLQQVWVTANVPENLVAEVAKGQSVDVSLAAYPGQVRRGTVSFVGDALDPDSRRNRARIAFANADGKLKPNMYATVSVKVPLGAQVSVPSSALLMNNDRVTVFVETAPWTFVRRAVELGAEDGASVRVLSGLRAGERVVVRGGVLLND